MSIFEFVFTLLSIVISLALTHLLMGVVAMIRNTHRIRFSAAHALWMWTAFATTIGNWATFWGLRNIADWPAWSVLSMVSVVVLQYVFAALVTPDVPVEGKLDLKAFHEQERQRYSGALIVLGVMAISSNVVFGLAGLYHDWARDTLLAMPELVVAVIALVVSARWVQLAAAIVIAAIATFFMIVGCNIDMTP